jgi:hypothetical protein
MFANSREAYGLLRPASMQKGHGTNVSTLTLSHSLIIVCTPSTMKCNCRMEVGPVSSEHSLYGQHSRAGNSREEGGRR